MVSPRKLSLTPPTTTTMFSSWPGEELLLSAGCTLCIPPSPHLPQILVIWVCPSFPKRQGTPEEWGPNLSAPACSMESDRINFSYYFPFRKSTPVKPSARRTNAQPVKSYSALSCFWNPLSYRLPSYSQTDVQKFKRSQKVTKRFGNGGKVINNPF